MISTAAYIVYMLNIMYFLIYLVLVFFKKKIRKKIFPDSEIAWASIIACNVWNTILIPLLYVLTEYSSAPEGLFWIPFLLGIVPVIVFASLGLKRIHDNLEET